MKKNDSFLSDIEKDIDGDWQDISKKIREDNQKEILEENLKKAKRLYFPSFKRFYETMKRIFLSYDGNDDIETSSAFHDLHVLLRSLFYHHDYEKNEDQMPKAFSKVWEIFCDPKKYKCSTGIHCNQCKARWDILFEIKYENRWNIEARWDNQWEEHSMIAVRHRIVCPSCGYPIYDIAGGSVVGVFKHEHIHEDEEEKINRHGGRGNEIKRTFEHYI